MDNQQLNQEYMELKQQQEERRRANLLRSIESKQLTPQQYVSSLTEAIYDAMEESEKYEVHPATLEERKWQSIPLNQVTVLNNEIVAYERLIRRTQRKLSQDLSVGERTKFENLLNVFKRKVNGTCTRKAKALIKQKEYSEMLLGSDLITPDNW